MSPPPEAQRPTAGQALLIIAAALVLAVSGCFGVFGVSATNGNLLQPLGLLVAVPVILFGVVGFFIGAVRLVRAFTSTAGDAPPDGAAPRAQGRPSFGQATLIFAAGTVVFLGACLGLVDGGNSASDLSQALFTLVFTAGVVAAAAGFALMMWRPRPAGAATPPPPPPASSMEPPQ